jgi:hypothetical protein
VVNIVLGLAIGSVADHWLVAFAIMLVATAVAIHGLATGAPPSVVMVIVALITLAASGG